MNKNHVSTDTDWQSSTAVTRNKQAIASPKIRGKQVEKHNKQQRKL
jgi:hypothetical protein